ncbi:MAG: hypothetical protein AAGA80_28645 [Cyanobacteria bacterium P01_F01_bin.143]
MSNILTQQSETTTASSQDTEVMKDNSQVLEPDNKSRDTPILSPLEIAVLENKKIAFYIPVDSNDYKESAKILLNWCTERLRKTNPELTKPDYEFEIGEAPDWNGNIDEKNRLIISYVGVARF